MQNRMWKQEEQPQSVTFACQSLWQAYSTNKVALCIQKLTGSRRANSTQLLTTIFSLSSVHKTALGTESRKSTRAPICASLEWRSTEDRTNFCYVLFCFFFVVDLSRGFCSAFLVLFSRIVTHDCFFLFTEVQKVVRGVLP